MPHLPVASSRTPRSCWLIWSREVSVSSRSMPADHVAQRGDRELLDRPDEVVDLVGGRLRLGDLEIDDGVDRDDEVVLGDHRLRREGDDLLPQIDHLADPVDEGDDDRQPGVQRARVAAEPFDDARPRLRHDANRPGESEQHEAQYDEEHDQFDEHERPPIGRRARSRPRSSRLPPGLPAPSPDRRRTSGPTTLAADPHAAAVDVDTLEDERLRAPRAPPSRCAGAAARGDGCGDRAEDGDRRRSTQRRSRRSARPRRGRAAPRHARDHGGSTATGLRENSPGVRISPTASRTAAMAHSNQAGTNTNPTAFRASLQKALISFRTRHRRRSDRAPRLDAMAKAQAVHFSCTECGYSAGRWFGQLPVLRHASARSSRRLRSAANGAAAAKPLLRLVGRRGRGGRADPDRRSGARPRARRRARARVARARRRRAGRRQVDAAADGAGGDLARPARAARHRRGVRRRRSSCGPRGSAGAEQVEILAETELETRSARRSSASGPTCA
mgnify:CR=1 FL=1